MGIWEAITELVEAATPWSVAEAEAPATEELQPEGQDESAEEPEAKESADSEEADDEEDDDDEEEEEETVDPKEKLEEECKNSKQCAPAKHHFDECVERVTAAEESGSEHKEDCVEEFFHLAHCATQCAAPKLWAQLK